MIRKLRVRFVAIMMVFATTIMAVTFVILNIRNYRKNETNLQSELDMTSDIIVAEMNGLGPNHNMLPNNRFSMSFGVAINQDKYVVYRYYCENLSNTDLNTLINLVLQEKSTKGSLSDYNLSYLVKKNGNNTIIVYVSNKFIDDNVSSTIWMSLYAFIVSTIVFIGISIWLSNIGYPKTIYCRC